MIKVMESQNGVEYVAQIKKIKNLLYFISRYC